MVAKTFKKLDEYTYIIPKSFVQVNIDKRESQHDEEDAFIELIDDGDDDEETQIIRLSMREADALMDIFWEIKYKFDPTKYGKG